MINIPRCEQHLLGLNCISNDYKDLILGSSRKQEETKMIDYLVTKLM